MHAEDTPTMNAEDTPSVMRESVHQVTRDDGNDRTTNETSDAALRTKAGDIISGNTGTTSSKKTYDISNDGREVTDTQKTDTLMKNAKDGIAAKIDKELDNLKAGENMKLEQNINNEPQVYATLGKAGIMPEPLVGQKRKSNTTEGDPKEKKSKSEAPQPVKKGKQALPSIK